MDVSDTPYPPVCEDLDREYHQYAHDYDPNGPCDCGCREDED